MNADAPPTPAQTFLALVLPAAQRAGYLDYGGKARLSRATGISESSITRMFQGKAIPEVKFFQSLADALDLDVVGLLTAAQVISDPSLSESRPSQVRSVPTTPEEAAIALGITSPEGVEMFLGVVDRLRKGEAEPGRDDEEQEKNVARRR